MGLVIAGLKLNYLDQNASTSILNPVDNDFQSRLNVLLLVRLITLDYMTDAYRMLIDLISLWSSKLAITACYIAPVAIFKNQKHTYIYTHLFNASEMTYTKLTYTTVKKSGVCKIYRHYIKIKLLILFSKDALIDQHIRVISEE